MNTTDPTHGNCGDVNAEEQNLKEAVLMASSVYWKRRLWMYLLTGSVALGALSLWVGSARSSTTEV
jgi:hypothetical protein